MRKKRLPWNNHLRAWRKRSGMSISELGQRSGYRQAFLSQLERGQHCPPVETCREIAAVFGLPIETVFYGAPPSE